MSRNRMWQVISVVAVVALVVGLAVTPAAAQGSGGNMVISGTVEQMPAGGLIGEWIIDGQTVVTDENTVFDDSFGPFEVGAYVRAVGLRFMGQFKAALMQTTEPDGGFPRPGHDQRHVYGYVEQMPTDGFVGTWVVDGESFEATTLTIFREAYGPLAVGAYVHVHFFEMSGVKYAILIGTVEEDMGSHWGHSGGMGGNFLGHVEVMPDGGVGIWVIDGKNFEASEDTQLIERFGPLEVGAYVFVHYWVEDDTRHATVIGTVPESTDMGGERAFGTIEFIPDGGIGDWVIDGVTYAVSEATYLIDEYAPLEVGAYVAVHYRIEGDTNLAIVIATVPEGAGPGNMPGESFTGVVESIPGGQTGDWIIGGETFRVSARTRLVEEYAPLEVGAYVYVYYFAANGVNHALVIATIPEEPVEHIVGQIEVIPEGQIGTWVINGENYEVTQLTWLIEDYASLEVGAYALVYYLPWNGVNYAAVVAALPDLPGETIFGTVESLPSSLPGDMMVDGTAYWLTDQALVIEDYASLEVGAYVFVQYQYVQILDKNVVFAVVPLPDESGTIPSDYLFGNVETMPDGGVGDWVIDGVTMTATEHTALVEAFAPLAVDAFAFAHYLILGNDNFATVIAGLPEDITRNPPGEHLFGEVESIPDGGRGEWIIGGHSFQVTALTQLIENYAPLEVGAYAFVHYWPLNDTDYALVVASVPREVTIGPNQHDFGEVEAIPEGQIGEWIIGGESYQVTELTRLVEEYAPLEVGAHVFVHYILLDGVRYATVIATVPEMAGGGNGLPGGFYFGYVEVMPAGGIGTWTISGMDFEADEGTLLLANHGLLDVGAYVRVRYTTLADGTLYARRIATTPEGTGQGGQGGMGWGFFGTVEQLPADWIGEWVIDDETFQANDETIFSERFGALEAGAFVHVRYYVEGDVKVAWLIATMPEGAGGLMGDLDGNCLVNVLDLMQVAGSWGTMAGQMGYRMQHDIDANGMVDFMDIMSEANFWGRRCAQPEAGLMAQSDVALSPGAAALPRSQGSVLKLSMGQPQALGDGLWQVDFFGSASNLGGFEMGLRLAGEGWELADVQLAPWLGQGRTWAPLQRQNGQRLTVGGFSFGDGPAASGKDVLLSLTLRGAEQPVLRPIYLRAADGQARSIPAAIR